MSSIRGNALDTVTFETSNLYAKSSRDKFCPNLMSNIMNCWNLVNTLHCDEGMYGSTKVNTAARVTTLGRPV